LPLGDARPPERPDAAPEGQIDLDRRSDGSLALAPVGAPH
jgi:hypothetical protein